MVELDNMLNEEDVSEYKDLKNEPVKKTAKKPVVKKEKAKPIEKPKKERTKAQLEAWDRCLAKRRENIKTKKEPVKQEPVKEEPVKQEPVKQEPVKQEPVNPFSNNNNDFNPLNKISQKKPPVKKPVAEAEVDSDQDLIDWGLDNEVEEESEESEEEEVVVVKKPKTKPKIKPIPKSKPKKIKYVYESESEESEEEVVVPKKSTNNVGRKDLLEGLDWRERARLRGF